MTQERIDKSTFESSTSTSISSKNGSLSYFVVINPKYTDAPYFPKAKWEQFDLTILVYFCRNTHYSLVDRLDAYFLRPLFTLRHCHLIFLWIVAIVLTILWANNFKNLKRAIDHSSPWRKRIFCGIPFLSVNRVDITLPFSSIMQIHELKSIYQPIFQ